MSLFQVKQCGLRVLDADNTQPAISKLFQKLFAALSSVFEKHTMAFPVRGSNKAFNNKVLFIERLCTWLAVPAERCCAGGNRGKC